MLEELSKKDKEWRIMALYICKDKYLADDLVNDMYLKLHDSNKQYHEINEWYVYRVLTTIHLNIIKRDKKTISLDDKNPIMSFAKYAANRLRKEKNDIDKENLDLRMQLDKALDELGFFDREILLHTSERSLRKNVEYLNQFGEGKTLNKNSLYYNKKKALEKLKNTETLKYFKTG